MKDEIAEKAAEECAQLDPHKFTTRQYVESMKNIIAEACRKASGAGFINGQISEIKKRTENANVEISDNRGRIFRLSAALDGINLSALSEPKKEETLTPKETKD